MLRREVVQEKYLPRRIRCSSPGNPELYNVNYENRQRNRIFLLNILSHNSFFNRNKSLFDFL